MIAGLAGTSALNAVTYLDMAVRARPASSVPQEAAGRLADAAHINLGPEDRAANRRSGLGPILGYVSGVGTSALLTALSGRRLPVPVAAVLLGAGAMVLSDAPLVALGVTDPRRWSGVDWIADVIPHLAYGFVAAATWRMLSDSRRPRR
jgi:hypothetical protein